MDESAYILLKQEYVGYAGRSVCEFIDHLLTTYGKKTDDMIKANLAALNEEFDCTGASLEALYIWQDKIQRFAIGTSGAITDATWMLQTTHVIESSGILNKPVLKWQGQAETYKNKPRFITDFNKYHKHYLSMFKHTPTPIAHNAQETNAEIDDLCSMVNETRTVMNQVVEAQNSARDDASIL